MPRAPLNARSKGEPRHGSLLRIEHAGASGFADVHPWSELGDEPLAVQLAKLAREEMTALTARSLHYARLDAAARREQRSLFAGLTIPESHWPHAAGPAPSAFDTVKIKLGPDPKLDPELARHRLRLDFNATLDAPRFEAFARALSPELREAIEFVEDPCPYDAQVWKALRQSTGLPLALDHGSAEASADVAADLLVIKPAVQPMPQTARPIVITSYMDHPLGQLAAVYEAARHEPRIRRVGLLTHLLYEEEAFAERLTLNGARLVPPDGTGFGFDDLLERLPWKPL